jgi:DNA-directed RNA polymerase subunit RPC12/RpoP
MVGQLFLKFINRPGWKAIWGIRDEPVQGELHGQRIKPWRNRRRRMQRSQGIGMEDIHCPYCEREVPVNEINMQRLVGRCLECGKLFDLEETPEFARRAPSRFSAFAASEPTRAKYAEPCGFPRVEVVFRRG